jgi:hypothetical protein
MKWVVLISSDYAGGFVGSRGMVKFKPEKKHGIFFYFRNYVKIYSYII